MMITKERIEFTKGILIEYVVKQLCLTKGISTEESLRLFLKSKTYDLLNAEETELCFESQEYVFDMIKNELDGKWDDWYEV